MDKKIEVLGAWIDNYTFRESILRAEKYLDNMVVNVIQMVSTKILNQATESDEIKEYLSTIDLSVISDTGILPIIGSDSKSRVKEIEEGYFTKTYLRRIRESDKSVCILATDENQIEAFEKYLATENISLSLTKPLIVDVKSDNFQWDSIANDINSNNIEIIISMMDIALNCEFLSEYQQQLSIEVFWGLGDDIQAIGADDGIIGGIKRVFFSKFLHRKVSKHSED